MFFCDCPFGAIHTVHFIQAQSEEEITCASELLHEYVTWLGVSLCFQNFDDEVASLPGEYSPPSGRLLLAVEHDQIAGCIALREIGEGICEMKRLYLRPQFQGKGFGRALAERVIADAREIGYRQMRLDTLPGKMDHAIALYRSLGFREIPAYYNNPVVGATFMELTL